MPTITNNNGKDLYVPDRVGRVIDRVRSGETLVKTFRKKATGDTEVLFTYHPSGKSAGEKSAYAAIATGLLKPGEDGLFGAELSQTWTA